MTTTCRVSWCNRQAPDYGHRLCGEHYARRNDDDIIDDVLQPTTPPAPTVPAMTSTTAKWIEQAVKGWWHSPEGYAFPIYHDTTECGHSHE